MKVLFAKNNLPQLIECADTTFYFDTTSLSVKTNLGTLNRSECDCSDDEYADMIKRSQKLGEQARAATQKFEVAVKERLNLKRYEDITQEHIRGLMYATMCSPWEVEV